MNFLPRRRRKPEVIIVSLIDIFAILLIFVIVTTTFKSEQPAVTIKLPESKTAVTAERGEEALRLSISEKEEIFLGAKKLRISELRAELDRLLALPNPPRLALAADKRAPVGTLIAILDILKQAGVKGELAAFTEPGTPRGASAAGTPDAPRRRGMTIPLLTLFLTAGICGVIFMLLELRDAPEGFEDEGGFHYAWRNNSPEASNISCIWDHAPAAQSPGPLRRAA